MNLAANSTLQLAAKSPAVTPPERRFVSLSLCSDRLLMALAEPQQIAAMSPFSRDPDAMLGEINTDKPIVKATLSRLLPYIGSTLLVNETFYPQLIARLRELGFSIIGINDNPQTPEELYHLIRTLGNIMGQQQKAEQLIADMPLPTTQTRVGDALLLSENGTVNAHLPQFKTLLQLTRLKVVKQQSAAASQRLSPEQILQANPDHLILFRSSSAYSHAGQLLNHPALQQLSKHKPRAIIPSKYTYCFDHGVWQGAKHLLEQLP